MYCRVDSNLTMTTEILAVYIDENDTMMRSSERATGRSPKIRSGDVI